MTHGPEAGSGVAWALRRLAQADRAGARVLHELKRAEVDAAKLEVSAGFIDELAERVEREAAPFLRQLRRRKP